MYSFAHLADCHLGAFRELPLREINLNSFVFAVEKCIEKKVDFIIISGDLFHSNIPDMDIVNRAVMVLKKANDCGIPVYVVYGSHDYSVNHSSIIDILKSAGIIINVFNLKQENGEFVPEFLIDKKTGAKISGMSARKMGNEISYFNQANFSSFEKETGFKIFIFHSCLDEMKPEIFSEMPSVPLSSFPRNVNYYAGGHVHIRMESDFSGYGKFVFPGVLFGADFRDLEEVSKNKGGFFVVHFDNSGIKEREFIKIDSAEIAVLSYSFSNKSAGEIREKLFSDILSKELDKKIVLIKVKGEITTGSISDIDFPLLIEEVLKKGAKTANLNRHSLEYKEKIEVKIYGEDISKIKDSVFLESIANFKGKDERLIGNRGFGLSKELFETLKKEQIENEKKSGYEERITKESLNILGDIVET